MSRAECPATYRNWKLEFAKASAVGQIHVASGVSRDVSQLEVGVREGLEQDRHRDAGEDEHQDDASL